MKALVLAAGQGTRLGRLTRWRPKAMLPVGGKPLLEHIIVGLRSHGICDIAVNIHHCPEPILQYFGDGCRLDVSLHYSKEERLLGTAGAAKHLQSFLDETFVVVYGDLWTNVRLDRLVNFHKERRNECPTDTMLSLALYRVPDPTQCGLVDITSTGRILRFVEKPPATQVFTDLAFGGIMICEPEILDAIPAHREYDFGHDLFPKLLANRIPLWGQPISDDELIVDIGTLAGYLRALRTWSALRQPIWD